MNYILFDGIGVMGEWLYMAAPRVYRMLGHIQAIHVVVVGGGNEQCSHHSGMVASWGRECWFPAFTRVQHDVFVGLECMSYLIHNIIVLGYSEPFM